MFHLARRPPSLLRLPGALVGGRLLGLVKAPVGRYISSIYQTVIAVAPLLILLRMRPPGIIRKGWEES